MVDCVYSSKRFTLFNADCTDVLKERDDDSIDAIVTDPPYELTTGKKGGSGMASVNLASPAGRSRIGTGGFMGKQWDATGISHSVELWVECLRVLKPGGHLLAFGGTRTWHRLAVAIEDAGFEMRDSIAWLYGSGFPKSLDVSKAIDKAAGAERTEGAREWSGGQRRAGVMGENLGTQTLVKYDTPATDAAKQWAGWGTALKPAFEPVVVARKPLIGTTVAANVLAYGTGALNIDACRIEGPKPDTTRGASVNQSSMVGALGAQGRIVDDGRGRWPANVVLDESQAAALDEQSGTSRFFYCAKAPQGERPKVDGVAHPTVKPLALMRWLVRLVTPPNGIVLDPFLGSGTTAEAVKLEGFRCIGIERDEHYIELIKQRLGLTFE